MQRTDPRFQKEQDTLKAMIGIYCGDQHAGHDPGQHLGATSAKDGVPDVPCHGRDGSRKVPESVRGPADRSKGRQAKGPRSLCAECTNLLDYALQRLEKCPFGSDKPKCSACTVHCYRKERREKIREVMRYAGPRMVTRHPVMTARHVWDGMVHRTERRES